MCKNDQYFSGINHKCFPPCFFFFSVMNSSFLTTTEEACFNYPLVTEWQSQSQPKWLPNKITAQSSLSLFSVPLEPRLDLEQPILAQNIHFILQPFGQSWCQHNSSHSPRLSLFHFIILWENRICNRRRRGTCWCSLLVDPACWPNPWAKGVWWINADTHTHT